MQPLDLLGLLRRYHFSWSNEKQLQDAIETVLVSHDLQFDRESKLSKQDRPDFMVNGGIALEIKVDGTSTEVQRQVKRYCDLPSVTAVILVTTRSKHTDMPASLNGKPIHVHRIHGL